ncbi:MAG: GNAT family N-acetyltransferase [Desulfobacteraceae bacterium]
MKGTNSVSISEDGCTRPKVNGRVEERPASRKLRLNERLALIGLIDEGIRQGSPKSPLVGDLFNDLWELVNQTVSGSKVSRLSPEDSRNGFRVIEVHAESGEILGHLNMLYLRKPIPCYYLVYVEVAAPFRNQGVGNRILRYFREFLDRKSTVGILDNIIPEEDPTYHIYEKQSWQSFETVIGNNKATPEGYMIYIPPRLRGRDLREPLIKVVHHLIRKREVIDMRDNEVMVQRTIAEFKDLHSALMTYFEEEIQKDTPSSLMRFMFTRFVTKFVAFRRRIESLLGYTGGESLEQISLTPRIAALPIQSYAPYEQEFNPNLVTGDMDLYAKLPAQFRKHPARMIESLPNYGRPNLVTWLKAHGLTESYTLTIGDLLALGFDPTRLKEISLDGGEFIFERIQTKQLPQLRRKNALLQEVDAKLPGARVKNAPLKTNPPLLVIRDRGNAYVLRQKVAGIHWEEAVEQICGAPHLKRLNRALNLRGMVRASVGCAMEAVSESVDVRGADPDELLACFVSWDLKTNRPLLQVDPSGAFLHTVWLA